MFLRKRTQPVPYTAYEVKTWMRNEVLYHPDDFRTGGALDTRVIVQRAVLAGRVTPDALNTYAHPAWDLAESVVAWYHGLQAIHTPRYADAPWHANR